MRPEVYAPTLLIVTIGYSTPWRQVHAMLEEAARRTACIDRDPAPYVRQTALADFYVEYRLIAHSLVNEPNERIDMLSALHANIRDAFNEQGGADHVVAPHGRPGRGADRGERALVYAPARPPTI